PNPTQGSMLTSTNEKVTPDFTIEIFPNPSHRFFNFTYDGPTLDKAELFLVDATGKKLMTILSNESLENGTFSQIDLGNYPIGIYFLNLFSASGQKSFLLSKNY
ncbi:MAG: T9SS type A sorting domain-containing protein, partial [Saprospiraceae bacterium]|nr:T9SS type A sorting domain-containing protein [Saprospiraceae bacterium]